MSMRVFQKIVNICSLLFIEKGDKTPILICSIGRGGSTLLGEILVKQTNRRFIFEPLNKKKFNQAPEFEYPEFFDPKEISDKHNQLEFILFGNYRSYWTDSHNKNIFCNGRIIKMIRGNLLIPYIQKAFPSIKIVLLIRNPLKVIESWERAGWNPINGKKKILKHSHNISKFMPDGWYNFYANETSDILNKIHFWAINYYIPLKLSTSIQLIRFEDLINYNSNIEPVEKLFNYLNFKLNEKKYEQSTSKPSRTSRKDGFLKKKKKHESISLLYSHKENEIMRILKFYDLEKIYPHLW